MPSKTAPGYALGHHILRDGKHVAGPFVGALWTWGQLHELCPPVDGVCQHDGYTVIRVEEVTSPCRHSCTNHPGVPPAAPEYSLCGECLLG